MEKENVNYMWSPEAEIVITGREFEAFAHLQMLFTAPIHQMSLKELNEFFGPATKATQDILKRMHANGLITQEVKTEQSEEG